MLNDDSPPSDGEAGSTELDFPFSQLSEFHSTQGASSIVPPPTRPPSKRPLSTDASLLASDDIVSLLHLDSLADDRAVATEGTHTESGPFKKTKLMQDAFTPSRPTTTSSLFASKPTDNFGLLSASPGIRNSGLFGTSRSNYEEPTSSLLSQPKPTSLFNRPMLDFLDDYDDDMMSSDLGLGADPGLQPSMANNLASTSRRPGHSLHTAPSKTSRSTYLVDSELYSDEEVSIRPTDDYSAPPPPSDQETFSQHDYRVPPASGSFVMASTSNGCRLYFPRKRGSEWRKPIRHQVAAQDRLEQIIRTSRTTLGSSIYRILDEIEQDRVENTLRRTDPTAQLEPMAQSMKIGEGNTAMRTLWVDKYKPRYFTDLISDEKINRETLLWLKQWDYCVFGRKNPSYQNHTKLHNRSSRTGPGFNTGDKDRFSSNRGSGADNNTNNNNDLGNQRGGGYDGRKNDDPYRRPFRKIMLLAGPPGLGKTTLAHIIAQQAGYATVEINASDDRSGTQVYHKLTSIAQSHSVRASGKPTALIIDEIDGVAVTGAGPGGPGGNTSANPRDFIGLLVAMAQAEASTSHSKMRSFTDLDIPDKSKGGGAANRPARRRKGPAPLMRPIICVCNNIYAPALRQLRTVAQVYHIRRPAPAVVAQRLQTLCLSEGLRADLSTLVALSSRSECDLRNCLHTLQFLHQQMCTSHAARSSMAHITWDMIKRTPVGVKDTEQSLFQLWERIFTPPSAQPLSGLTAAALNQPSLTTTPSNGPAAPASTNLKIRGTAYRREYLENLYADLVASGEYDKLIQGCFENYLRLRFHDSYFQKIVQTGDWFAYYDLLNAKLYSTGGSSQGKDALLGYMPYSLMFAHSAMANPFAQNHEWSYPRVDYEMRTQQRACEQILLGTLTGMRSLSVRRHWTVPKLALELISSLTRIIATPITGSNVQLLKPDERAEFDRLVAVMAHSGLTYVQERSEDGQFQYRIEPPLELTLVADKLNLVVLPTSATLLTRQWEKPGTKDGSGTNNGGGTLTAKRTTSLLPTKYATQQMIAQEVEKEIIRRRELALRDAEEALTAVSAPSTNRPSATAVAAAAILETYTSQAARRSTMPPPSAPQDNTPTQMSSTPPTKVAAPLLRDFFGRPIQPQVPSSVSPSASPTRATDKSPARGGYSEPVTANNPTGSRIWYQFNEGFSNAVRKPVKISEFLL
ncbi:Chromosome transmission fidelity protein 18 [Dimargaris cristalligena]|nr:Chromosome transmission fidelity protein 18 [Dimargaris cristalligena]